MAKERKSFLLRVEPKLHDALRRWADDELRSLNAQVELLLRQSLQQAGRLKEKEEDPALQDPPADASPEGEADRGGSGG